MPELEKSLLPDVVFAEYVTRPSRRSLRILRPIKKKASANKTRPPTGIAIARSSPTCALMENIMPSDGPQPPADHTVPITPSTGPPDPDVSGATGSPRKPRTRYVTVTYRRLTAGQQESAGKADPAGT